MPHLSVGKRGPKVHVAVSKVIGAILYKLKTGCQWRLLPVKELFGEEGLGWQGVYYHFQRWAAEGSLRRMWVELLRCKRRLLHMCSGPVAGNHHDLFEIEKVFGQLTELLKEAGLEVEGLFLNADAGFDSETFRRLCSSLRIEANIAFNPRNGTALEEYVYFDPELYRRRNTVEQACAWLDSFKALLVRFETKASNWMALHFLAFTVLFISKIKNQKNPKQVHTLNEPPSK